MSKYRSKSKKKRRRQIMTARIVFVAVVLAVLALCAFFVEHLVQAAKQVPDAGSPPAASSSAESVAPTPTPDPAVLQEQTWSAAGKAFMSRLTSQEEFASLDLTATEELPYLVCVNRAASCVTVYVADTEGRFTQPYMAMVCSGGTDTPTGIFATPVDYPWRLLAGNVYGQYATRIWDAYLFHSVPYYSQHKDDLEYDEFNKLGTIASLGCIRLATVDVKWIYDNCPIGTPVVIYDDAGEPGPLGKPTTIQIDTTNLDLRGWDPTDPDENNPYGDQYKSGTAIRTAAAQADWDAAQADGRWNDSLTPSDLQGWNHDSAIVGTAG